MTTFNELGISKNIIDKLSKKGIKEPTEIQSESITDILEGKDVILKANTGTGKTLAFLLPLFETIKSNRTLQGLIMVPTRELAIQIEKEIEILKEEKNIETLLIYGGKGLEGQAQTLRKGVDLVIATPGRLADHLKRGTINLSKVNKFIIDEVDQMLQMGFKNEIDQVYKKLAKKKQVICLSATLDRDSKKLIYRYTKDAKFVETVDKSNRFEGISHYLVETTDRRKQDTLCQVLNLTKPFMGIIFCRTKKRVDVLEMALAQRGYSCQKLHSDIPQSKREKIIKSFKNVEFQFLIATDVAARGVDIAGITHVYNYDMPESSEIYTHRVGRTARRGETGDAYTFSAPKDNLYLDKIQEELAIKLEKKSVDYVPDVMAENSYESKKRKKVNTNTKTMRLKKELENKSR